MASWPTRDQRLKTRDYRLQIRRCGRLGVGPFDEKIRLVPDEIVLAVHRELVVLAHEDRGHGTGLLAKPAEDTARLVDLVDLGVPRTGEHGAVVLLRLEVDSVGRARDG